MTNYKEMDEEQKILFRLRVERLRWKRRARYYKAVRKYLSATIELYQWEMMTPGTF